MTTGVESAVLSSDLVVGVIGKLEWSVTVAAAALIIAATLAALGVMVIVIAVPVMLVIDTIDGRGTMY